MYSKTLRVSKSRKEHRCESCGKPIPKGTPYYKERGMIPIEGQICSWEIKRCPKCKFKKAMHQARFERFKAQCHHPLKDTHYDYIPGEAVMEPQYDYCRVCGQII